MLPSSIEYFEYKDLRHNKNFKITRDINEILNLAVKDDANKKELLEENELLKINVYSNIAAGIPIYINSERQGIFYLPDKWFKGMNSIFMLKVRGTAWTEQE
ncbi:MAG: S24 family peptidase [Bacillota bacterium]|nr:S24 family peptidase [Bacillota bacterium]